MAALCEGGRTPRVSMATGRGRRADVSAARGLRRHRRERAGRKEEGKGGEGGAWRAAAAAGPRSLRGGAGGRGLAGPAANQRGGAARSDQSAAAAGGRRAPAPPRARRRRRRRRRSPGSRSRRGPAGMSYKPIAPAPASASPAPGPAAPPAATSVPSPSGSAPGAAAAPFRPLFNDFGPPSMGYVQAMKPPGAPGSQSTYTDLLSVIEEMGKEIRPTYAGSKSAMERLKRGIIHARALVRECLAETERNART